MRIISMVPGRQSKLCWLKLSEGRLLPLKIDDYFRLKLTKNLELSDQQVLLIQRLSFLYLLEEYALRQVAISPKTRTILIPKLKEFCRKIIYKYQYPNHFAQESVDEIIIKLENNGLLNNSEYVDYFIKRHPKMSHLQLIYKLNQLGINIRNINHTIPEDKEKIRRIIDKKYAKSDLKNLKVRFKIISALARQGFTVNHIKSVIDDYLRIR